jgi:glycosyltransferase involved in cell wall biosynthesis
MNSNRRTRLHTMIEPARMLVVQPALVVGKTLLRDRPEPTRAVWAESARLWMPANREIEISVVMPAYNPGAALRPAVDRLVDVMRAEGIGFELIVVSDGSTDGSMATLEGVGPELRIIELPANRGKGGALHAGFSRARGSWVGFVDSDGDIDPAHLVGYLKTGRETGADLVYANKKHRDSVSASSPLRKLVSFGFSSIVGTLFSLGVNDTQTGCKLVRREVLADVLPRLRETRFAFDLELFVAASTAGYTTAVAAPVELKERMAGSTVSKSTIVRTLKDALTVLARRHSTPTYRDAVRPMSRVYSKNVGVLPRPARRPHLHLAHSAIPAQRTEPTATVEQAQVS